MADGNSGRFMTIVKAKINRLLNNMEDPAETLDFAYKQQVDNLQNIKKGIANVVTAKKRLEMQQDKLEKQVVKLDQQARAAVGQNNEDLARIALERKRAAQMELQNLDTQVEEMKVQQEQLIKSKNEMQSKIEQFRMKKEVIKAQYAAAEAQVSIAASTTGIGGSQEGVALALERAYEKVDNMRARADASQELVSSGAFDDVLRIGSGQDDIDIELAKNPGNDEIESEINAIRAELSAGGSTTGALEEGDADPVEATPVEVADVPVDATETPKEA